MGSAAPLILALETATARVSAALLRGEELLGEEVAAEGRAAAEVLLPCVDGLLLRHGLTVGRVDAFAVSVGPGSFTGLRIGIATAKGLAFGSAAAVAPVSTLAALARGAASAGPVVATLDARRGELYAGAFEASGAEPHPCVPEGVYRPEEIAGLLPGDCAVVGEGVALFEPALRARLGPRVRWDPQLEPRASRVGELGALRLAGGGAVDAADLLPHYLRRAEAEVRRTGLRFEAGRDPSRGGNPRGCGL